MIAVRGIPVPAEACARSLKRSDFVVMDALFSHERASVRELIEAAGACLMLLPPYSPGFNSAESAFAHLKAMLSKVGKRTVSGL